MQAIASGHQQGAASPRLVSRHHTQAFMYLFNPLGAGVLWELQTCAVCRQPAHPHKLPVHSSPSLDVLLNLSHDSCTKALGRSAEPPCGSPQQRQRKSKPWPEKGLCPCSGATTQEREAGLPWREAFLRPQLPLGLILGRLHSAGSTTGEAACRGSDGEPQSGLCGTQQVSVGGRMNE